MGTPARYYSSTAVRTTLATSVSSTDTEIVVASSTNFPTQYPFTLILEKDSANEEILTVTSKVGTSFIVTRGFDGTSARAHAAGTSVEHGVSAKDFTDFRSHEAASNNVHDIGAGSAVVGTATSQTLSNKTLGSNLAAGGFKITGLADPTSAQDAVTKVWAETGMTSQLTLAEAARTAAQTAQASAEVAETNAETAEANAETAQAAAESARNAAQTARTGAEAAQSAAATSATNAASSATSASGSASTATTQASAASASASSAASSATAASASQSAAAASESAAATSASNAASSASAAASSESHAASSESAAAGSATSAASSATSASASASAAATSETNAAASESAAGTSETNAAASEAAASTSASNASTSASNAATSATNAAASAVDAANSAAAAATALDSFDDRYLGAKSVAPTLDNDGNALVQGALYYLNTGTAEQIGMYVFDGSGWLKASAASVASIVTYEYTATASQTVFTGVDNNSVSLSFTAGLIQVFLNGVLLNPGDDYTTTVNTVTLVSGAAVGDSLTVVAFASFNVANTYTIAQTDAAIATATAGLGGATGGGTDQIFYENGQTVTTSYTLSTNKNAVTAGPVTINSGVTVTIPSGSSWVVV